MSTNPQLIFPQSQTTAAQTPTTIETNTNTNAFFSDSSEDKKQQQRQAGAVNKMENKGALDVKMKGSSENSKKTSHQERGDDWDVDNNSSDLYDYLSKISPFIQAFMIRRIIRDYIDDNKDGIDSNTKLERLENLFKKNSHLETNYNIVDVLKLLIDDGFKTFMNTPASMRITVRIFNEIILKKFETEYNQLATYEGNTNGSLVFNSSDLMCSIFHYLELKMGYGKNCTGDLVSCSLVNSHWLYHAWNVNAIFHADLTGLAYMTLIKQTFNRKRDDRYDNIAIKWHRLSNAKSISLWIRSNTTNSYLNSNLLLRKLAILKSFDRLNITFDRYNTVNMPIMKRLMVKSFKRLKKCTIQVNKPDEQVKDSNRYLSSFESYLLTRQVSKPVNENTLSSLPLMNARYICIDNLYFYPIWGNKCNELAIKCKNVSEKWCQFVIDKCDCSNVKKFTFFGTFNAQFVNKSILQQLVQKFHMIERLRILISTPCDKNIILLWQLLKNTLLQNNGKVELHTVYLSSNDFNFLIETIEKQNLDSTIGMLSFLPNHMIWANGKYISEMDCLGLKHLKMYSSELINIFAILNASARYHASFESIKILEIESIGRGSKYVNDLYQFLATKTIIDKELFLIANIKIDCPRDGIINVLPLNCVYKRLTKLISKGIPIDFKIMFMRINGWIAAYWSRVCAIMSGLICTSEDEYKQPQCNSQLYVSRSRLLGDFVIHQEENYAVLFLSNASYVGKL